ncbi:MAG: hypothetical protein AAB340_02150 [Patescibacteria group bacterium]
MSVVLQQSVEVDRDIQVAGFIYYPENRWREAILAFLFELWSEKLPAFRPKIILGQLTLRLNSIENRYFVYGKGADRTIPEVVKALDEDARLLTSDSRSAVETGLIRFVKNNRIKALQIYFCYGYSIVLWKKDRRGEYGCWSGDSVPESFGGLGAYSGTREFGTGRY